MGGGVKPRHNTSAKLSSNPRRRRGASRESDMAEDTQVGVKKLSFERAMEELEIIVTRLEGGKGPLEESVAIYERGESLKRRGEELLRPAGGWGGTKTTGA